MPGPSTIPIRHGHVGPGFSQREGETLTDATGTSGHDSHSTGQVKSIQYSHRLPPATELASSILTSESLPYGHRTVRCAKTISVAGPPELRGNPVSNGPQFDRYGGSVNIQGQRTGFFHTERINDRWWLVTPDGHGFFGMGLSHPITSMSEAAITFVYGDSQEEWMRDGIRKMRALGFNCFWSGPYSLERIPSGNNDTDLADRIYREAEIPHAIHVPLIKHQVELKPGARRPDVFRATYRRFVGEEVARRVAPHRDKPWVLGYYYGYGSFMREDLWLNETQSHEPGSPGREQLFDVLEQRYHGDIAQLNTVYGTSFASFPDLRQNGSLTYRVGSRPSRPVNRCLSKPVHKRSSPMRRHCSAQLSNESTTSPTPKSASMTRSTWHWEPTSSTQPSRTASESALHPTSISSAPRMSVT